MEQMTESPLEAQSSGIAAVVEPLYQVKGWIKFAGIMTIIGGAAQVLSLWGIIIAWLPIWMGVLLVSSANLLEQAYTTKDGTVMRQSFEKLGKYFKLIGIFIVVMLVIAIIGIIAAITIPALIGLKQASMGM
jgi:hypothetical protein